MHISHYPGSVLPGKITNNLLYGGYKERQGCSLPHHLHIWSRGNTIKLDLPLTHANSDMSETLGAGFSDSGTKVAKDIK